jgi:hypothetical protein
LAERFEVVVAKAQDIFLAKAEFCPLAQIFAFTFNGSFVAHDYKPRHIEKSN